MKKILAIMAILALAGCCTSPNNSQKNIGNCLAKISGPIKSVLCPPNQAQIDQARRAAAFIFSTFFHQDFSTEIALAASIFEMISQGICVELDQLAAAIATLDALVASLTPIPGGGGFLSTSDGFAVIAPDISQLRAALKK